VKEEVDEVEVTKEVEAPAKTGKGRKTKCGTAEGVSGEPQEKKLKLEILNSIEDEEKGERFSTENCCSV
jgi:hypothetical protein